MEKVKRIRIEYKEDWAEYDEEECINHSWQNGEISNEVAMLKNVLRVAKSLAEYGYTHKIYDISEIMKIREAKIEKMHRWLDHSGQSTQDADKLLAEVLPKLIRKNPEKNYHVGYSIYF